MKNMLIERPEQIQIAATPYGDIRWVEFAGQKWVARSDLLNAVGYARSSSLVIARTISSEHMMTADRMWREGWTGKMTMLNAAGVEEFAKLPLRKKMARKIQPALCDWLKKYLFGEKMVPLFEEPTAEDEALAEAERALNVVFDFLQQVKDIKRRKEKSCIRETFVTK